MATLEASPTVSPIGRDTVRVDGPRKVTGVAQYTSDFHFPGMLYAVPVGATIANAKITWEWAFRYLIIFSKQFDYGSGIV